VVPSLFVCCGCAAHSGGGQQQQQEQRGGTVQLPVSGKGPNNRYMHHHHKCHSYIAVQLLVSGKRPTYLIPQPAYQLDNSFSPWR
jgi:hypothetical protein